MIGMKGLAVLLIMATFSAIAIADTPRAVEDPGCWLSASLKWCMDNEPQENNWTCHAWATFRHYDDMGDPLYLRGRINLLCKVKFLSLITWDSCSRTVTQSGIGIVSISDTTCVITVGTGWAVNCWNYSTFQCFNN